LLHLHRYLLPVTKCDGLAKKVQLIAKEDEHFVNKVGLFCKVLMCYFVTSGIELSRLTQIRKEAASMGTLLDERLIILDADVHSAEDCIRLMAGRFEEYGYVKPGYADAVIEREKSLPTGLPGKEINLAIPHTNNKLVIKPAVGVIIPREPVEFRMMGMKETRLNCKVVLPLVVKDSKQQIGMLKKMMKIIQDNELIKRMNHSKSRTEIRECLSSLEDE
jgi:PTS system galactitol-specific IIA component